MIDRRAWLVSLVADTLRLSPEEVDVRAPLARHGLDSLASVELTAALSAAVGRDLPDSLLLDHPDVEALERYLASGADGAAAPDDPLEAMLRDAALPAEVRPEGAPPEPAWPPRAPLLTGATGFLGAYLLRGLLRAGAPRVRCLVRADGTAPLARLRRHLAAVGLREAELARRVEGVAGDLAAPRLGLSELRFDALARDTDLVLHAAAAVSWVQPYRALRDANVGGTLELLRLACRGRATPFHFVSTLGVCYSTRGPRHVAEGDEMLPDLRGLHFGYVRSKWVAEALVRAAGRRGLPVAVYRPTFISGDSASGWANPEDFLAALLRGCVHMGAAPDLDWTLDACPVDHVADAVLGLARRPGAGPRVFHLSNPAPRQWRECVLWLNLRGYDVALLPYRAWLDRLAAGARDPSHPLGALAPFFLARPLGPAGPTLPELYEDGRASRARCETTRARLAALSLACPALDARLLDRYVTWLVRRGALPEPPRPGGRPRRPARRLDAARLTALLRRGAGNDTLEVREVEPLGDGSEHSILTELTSWQDGGAAGLFRYRLTLASRAGEVSGRRDVVIKAKPEDTAVLAVGERVARLCDPALGRAYARWCHRLPPVRSHLRELAVYEQDDPRFRRHAPALLGSLRDDRGRAWLLALERLDDVVLLDAADEPGRWREAHVEAAVRGIAEVHAIWYGREVELRARPWLGPVLTAAEMAEMADLWEALADHAAPRFRAWAGPGVTRRQRALTARVGRWWRALERMPRTLVHNDFNPRNLALRRDEDGYRLCAYDWELATLAVPQRDLAELLCFVLPPDVPRDVVLHHLEGHRVALERAAGRRIDPAAWRLGFRLSLYDLMLTRLPMYALVDRFRRQAFLPRVVRTWAALDALVPSLPGGDPCPPRPPVSSTPPTP